MRLRGYLIGKTLWYLGAMVVAVGLNFLLPRLVPGNPVDAIVAQLGRSGTQAETLERIHRHYVEQFGLDQPLWSQFLTYLGNLAHFDLGTSFASYPAKVESLILEALPWTIGLQLPAILIGWLVGNALGALAAFKGGLFDRGAFLSSLFLSSMPYYCLAIILLYLFAVALPILPPGGGYEYGTTPELSIPFIVDVLRHYWLPFFSLVLIFVGGQAVGMRSMAIYELNSDYVNYGRSLGLPDNRIVRYIFRNAMLPQLTGLALSIGTLVGGALVTEIVFSYPGIGYLLFSAISQNDYPVIQAITLIIVITVLVSNFLVEVAYGFVDPRIRAAQAGER
ncbi:ABC transporter permease [Thermasporomyces composti]|jgi:peptide/nickel transport system permease protein|uniref:Peptide/nickel transport system permease protein n=1 Tax=Thermasporomyces composti TaxID=696763 RepID=A0A3D9VJU4_THECX|nr:ABC transporter permease [Thermasporomyces composti]REF37621.1 peptide/nickel transport system permease protein [Thermasporomyces composti]